MEKKLGKISKVTFGLGGYQGCMLGVHLNFMMGSTGCGTTISAWDAESIKCDNHCKWTEKDRSKQYDEIMRKVSKLLNQAKVKDVSELEGIPVEVTIDDMTFKDFRILEEVL